MRNCIDLCGKWQLNCETSPLGAIRTSASVPGCVHTDLISAGMIQDMYFRDNFEKVTWIENCDFTYKKTFTVPTLAANAYLEFDGLDTYADIYLNAQKLGETDDMFHAHHFCVDGILKEGENELEVRFFSPIERIKDLPLRKGAFTRERMNTRRIQCTYSWDWVARFVTMGIYRPVRLVWREKNEIDHVYVYTSDVNPYSAQIKMEITLRDFCDCRDTVHIELTAPDGSVVLSKDRVALQEKIYETIDVADPQLWYPIGYGAQPLYTVTVSSATSKKTERIGIRKVTVLQIQDPEDSEYRRLSLEIQKGEHLKIYDHNKTSASFTVLVNNIKIMCKGGNWVPCDPFPSAESPEKIRRLLELAAAGGVNTVRVWGGGIFEQDVFYSECDRLGLLVTHDFLMACGHYPEEKEWFIRALNKETKEAALRLRNHPCLIYWCGDNENAFFGTENHTDFPGYRTATFGIEPILREYDPHRYFFTSSPYGGEPYASSVRGTTHVTCYLDSIFPYMQHNDMKDYRKFFSKYLSRFCCEYPAFGLSFVSSLKKYMTDDDIFQDEKMTMFEAHTRHNPDLQKPLFWLYADMALKLFGAYENGEDRVRKNQMLHCETTRFAFELYRRNKGYAWGLIYWMLNDCWPAASGWSFLDYYACPKPAYYTFQRCAKEVIATISETNGTLSLHVCNDALRPVTGKAKLYVYDFQNDRELWSTTLPFSVRENRSEELLSCDFAPIDTFLSDTTVLLCDLTSDANDDRAFFIKDRFCDLKLTYSAPIVLSEDEETITVTSDRFQPYVILDVPYLLSDNCFALKAGEVKTLKKRMAL